MTPRLQVQGQIAHVLPSVQRRVHFVHASVLDRNFARHCAEISARLLEIISAIAALRMNAIDTAKCR